MNATYALKEPFQKVLCFSATKTTLFSILPLWFLFLTHPISSFAQGKVGINTEQPTATLDINGSIRIRDLSGEGKVLVSDSSGIGKWKFLPSDAGISILQFGAIPNDGVDDTEAILMAIDSVSSLGGKLTVPRGIFDIQRTIVLPDGVYLEGEGRGSDPLESPVKGSIIRYSGEEWAVRIKGHYAGLRNLTITEKQTGNGANGVQVLATGRLVESVLLGQVHVYGFSSGTGLELKAENGGGIAYASLKQVRIRHAKIGISLLEDETSFVNSNLFQKIVVSGGGFESGISISGGNNNVFMASVIEPYESEVAHLHIVEGQISAYDIRIEGRDQGNVRPLIKIGPGTFNNVIEGVFSGGFIEDMGANRVRMISSRNMQFEHPGSNMLVNSGFLGVHDMIIPKWSLAGSISTIEVSEEELIPGHKVLKVVVPPGEIGILSPQLTSLPQTSPLSLTQFCSMGIYGKTEVTGAIQLVFNDKNGEKQSIGHSGSNYWEVIGLSGYSQEQTNPFPRVRLINSQGTDPLVCYLTIPSFTFGYKLPEMSARPIRETGGQVFGTLSTSLLEVEIPTDHRLFLPHSANVFLLSGNTDIHRINDQLQDQFPKGCVITLVFNDGGIKLQQIGYLFLLRDYISTQNSSITLVSLGDGTWKEINRNL